MVMSSRCLGFHGQPLNWRSNGGCIYVYLLLPPWAWLLLSLKANDFDLSYSVAHEGSGNNPGILWHNWKHSLAFALQVVCSQWNNKWAHEPILTAYQGQILAFESLLNRCKSKAEQEYVGNYGRLGWLMDLLKVDNHKNKNFGCIPDYFRIAHFTKVQLLQRLCVRYTRCSLFRILAWILLLQRGEKSLELFMAFIDWSRWFSRAYFSLGRHHFVGRKIFCIILTWEVDVIL